jgi:hypothetical protein
MRWVGHVARMGEKRNAYRLLVGKPEGFNMNTGSCVEHNLLFISGCRSIQHDLTLSLKH